MGASDEMRQAPLDIVEQARYGDALWGVAR